MLKSVPVVSLENPVLIHVVEHVLLQLFKHSFSQRQSNHFISPNQVNENILKISARLLQGKRK